jgi:hypothetical protein
MARMRAATAGNTGRRSTVLEPFGALLAAAFVLYAALMVMVSESHR